jgi:excisionase family DNA binding protein
MGVCDQKIWSSGEVARQLNVPTHAVTRLATAGRIRLARVGGRYVVFAEQMGEIRAALESHRYARREESDA